jgi:hypothetical protein
MAQAALFRLAQRYPRPGEQDDAVSGGSHRFRRLDNIRISANDRDRVLMHIQSDKSFVSVRMMVPPR